MREKVLLAAILTSFLASCGQSNLPETSDTSGNSTPLQLSPSTSSKISAQYLYTDKTRCPDKITYESQDVNVVARYACTIAAAGAGGLVIAVSCTAPLNVAGCLAASGITGGTILGCSEVYAAKRVQYRVTTTYLADSFYNPPRCFIDKVYRTPIN